MGQNLKFTDHIQNDKEALIKVLNKRLFALRKLAFLTSFKSRKMIANGLIMSKMVYLIPLWAGTEKYLLNSLQMIQNKAARVVRASSDLRIRLGRQSQAGTELAKKSFKYRATRDWNMLPLEIKQARKVETFKIMLKRWVSENISIS